MKTKTIILTVIVSCIVGALAASDLHPIVEVESGYFLGATLRGKWIRAEEARKLVEANTSYRIYALKEELKPAIGGKPKSVDEPCPDTYEVSLNPKPEKAVIGLAAPWNALPRKAQKLDPTQKVYLDAVADYLKAQEFKSPKVKITQILRIDLDGDGEEEVLISATNYGRKGDGVPMRAPPDSYSLVILRRVVHGQVRTQLVAGEFYPTPKHADAPNMYEIAAVLDLNGDGKLEIVVHSAYYEGGETLVYEYKVEEVREVLSVACGA